jgi:membrane protein YqaA with SNARE-associated domain
MEILHSIATWLEATLLPYGPFGLMVLAICDSSFLSLPEVNDVLLMTFSIRQPDRMVTFAAMTTLGSVIGCAMLFAVGRGSGAAFLRRRARRDMSAGPTGHIQGWYERYGMLAVIVPSLLPPPAPFKMFVLSAGAFGISWPRFLVAVGIGRSIRYFAEGILAVMYGEQAIAFVHANFPTIGIAVSLGIIGSAIFFVFWRRRRRSEPVP